MNHSPDFVRDFREAAPYIHFLRGKTLVIGVADSLLEGDMLGRLAADLNLLSALGVRLVLVHGMSRLLDRLAGARRCTPQYYKDRRIADDGVLEDAKQAAGMIRSNIEAALYSSVSVTQRIRPLSVASGSILTARPLGIIDGIDMENAGIVRKIDTEAVNRFLDGGSLVLVSPLGHSYSGRTFCLSMSETAEAVAVGLQAEKLIYLTEQPGITASDGRLLSTLSSRQVRELIDSGAGVPKRLLQSAVNALEHGIGRVQILSGREDGSLLRELFTREGSGTSLARDSFVRIRQASGSDIPHIISLIRPLEEQGVLLPRSREYLENHIGSFSVLEHDRNIYGCAALKTFSEPESGEIACLVVSPQARDGGYGEMLLEHLLQKASGMGIRQIFALSTHTGEWFLERGFQTAAPESLPQERYRDYIANGRNSKVFVCRLKNPYSDGRASE